MKISNLKLFLFLSLFFTLTVFIQGFLFTNNMDTYYVIKVHVKYGNNNPVEGADVRVAGSSFEQCCVTGTSGTCAFYVNNTGDYSVCGSKNNYGNSTTVTVRVDQSIYDVYIYITQQGVNCQTCPDTK